MANIKEVKNRISNVRDTQKITNAMYLIASTKVRRAKAELEKTRPYFDAVRREIRRIFASVSDVESPYFRRRPVSDEEGGDDGRSAVLVITADKGLAGVYNQNVIKEAQRICDAEEGVRIYMVGEYGRRYFLSRGSGDDILEQHFLFTAQNPTLDRARKIALTLDDAFRGGEIDRVYVCYTDYAGGLEGGSARTELLLPLDSGEFVGGHRAKEPEGAGEGFNGKPARFEFLPSAAAILDNLVLSYLTGYIYSALVDSFCSEQNARMTAMDSANQNAEELLARLNLEYNHMRQAAITREITEISAGAKAKRRLKENRL